jgi:hypothetical protein
LEWWNDLLKLWNLFIIWRIGKRPGFVNCDINGGIEQIDRIAIFKKYPSIITII